MRVPLNGVTYNVERAGQGAPLLLLHGFTGSAATWRTHVAILENFATLALDFLGHGESDAPEDPRRYGMHACIGDLCALLDYFEIERANVLGYSMGGRVALHFAHAHPERIGKLILESASPGIENPSERRERAVLDKELANRVEREGIQKFVEEWTNNPLFATQARLPDAEREKVKAQRLQNRPQGLGNSLRGLSVGAQQSLWDQLPRITVPTLLLAGQLDQKFSAIAETMYRALPNARLEIVPDAGHAVHLEQPETFQRLALNFFTQA